MVKLRALVPEATVNYIKNPALRYDTTDWNTQGSTISRVLTRARFGIASLKVVTAGTALREGAYFRVSSLSGVSEPITVSAYVRGSGKVRIRLDNNVVGGSEFFSQGVQLTDDRWTRLTVSGFSSGGNDLRLFVETDESAAVVRTFYVDGAQLERKSYATTYCDGDQEGCRWNGIYHNSASQRSGATRAGGKWIELSGPDREAEDLYMTIAGGLGAAPLVNNTQSFAQAPGGYFSNRKVNMRLVTLTFHAKHTIDDEDKPVSLAHLHNLRQMLIDIVKPDRTGGDEDICFEYDDGTVPLYFKARYDGGLEGEWDVRNQFVNSFPLRILATNPIMQENSQEAAEIDFQDSFIMNYVAGRINGRWDHLNYGFDEEMANFALGTRGEVFAHAGLFTTVNNNAAAVDPLISTRGPVYWDGEKWNKLSSGLNAGNVSGAIAIAPNGYIYVGGDFATIGGVAAARIAYWDGSTWNAMGTGLNGICNTIAVAPNGDVYAGGDFTSAGGVTVDNIARWDGFQWRRVGQFGGLIDGASAEVNSIVVSKDGLLLYVGGVFTQEAGGQALSNVAQYNTVTGLFSPLGSGTLFGVNKLVLSNAGTLYAAGTYLVAVGSEFAAVAQWDGSTWTAMGSEFVSALGTDAGVFGMAVDENEHVYIAGNFVRINGVEIIAFALWTGATWVSLDINPNGIDTNWRPTIFIHPNGDLFIEGDSGSADGPALCAGITRVTNTGSTEADPVFYLKGPGNLRWLENQTNQKRLYLDLQIEPDEEVFIDIGRGTIRSAARGNILYSILAGSDFRSFTLLPGENKIAAFMVDDVDAQMSVQFTPRHWSVDATQRGNEV